MDHRAGIVCGALAGPLFVVAFTVIGARRPAYDWQRHPVSSLAVGHRGWQQRVNFMLAGVLYSYAARDLRPRRSAVRLLVATAGIGLMGSGFFVTDPIGGFPPEAGDEDRSNDASLAETPPTREGARHNFCAVPVFAGIPLAGLASAGAAIRNRDYRWAGYSAVSSFVMVVSFVLFGAALGDVPRLAGKGGFFQRISIASGFGWLTALFLRALSS